MPTATKSRSTSRSTRASFKLPTGFDFTRFELPKFELPRFELPKFELPKFERPTFNVPKVELPKVDLSKVELPRIDTDRLGEVARDAAYASIGLVVLTAHKVDERRRDIQADVTSRVRQVVDAIV